MKDYAMLYFWIHNFLILEGPIFQEERLILK